MLILKDLGISVRYDNNDNKKRLEIFGIRTQRGSPCVWLWEQEIYRIIP